MNKQNIKKKLSANKERSKKKYLILFIVLLLISYILLIILPYVRQPEISEEYKNEFDINKYLGRSDDILGDESVGISVDRAVIIEDNEDALKERIRLISNAKEEIIMSTFAFKSDESGKDMISALLDAGQRGVKVYIYVDGYSAWLDMNTPYFKALASEANIEIKVYNKVNLLTPWTLMGRMHDKYLIADDTAYIVGGRNTFDYFLGDYEGYKNHDRDVLIYNTDPNKGDSSVYELQDYFNDIWNLDISSRLYENIRIKEGSKIDLAKSELRHRYGLMKNEKPEYFTDIDYINYTFETKKVRVLSNPTQIYPKEPQVLYAMTQFMINAQESVDIHTPYIICNDTMYEALSDVSNIVGDARLLTNSVANNGNPFGAGDYKRNKNKILDTGIKIYEYEGGISYHSKSILIDNHISIFGSFNMDIRSAYLDTEIMVVVDSEDLNAQLKNYMKDYEASSRLAVDEDNYITPEGLDVQKISFKRWYRMNAIRFLGGWLRFLM